MSFHVLHIFKHGSVLAKDRGFIVCRAEDKSEHRIPHEDLRAVIIAARGVTLTSSFVSAVLETDGIILHCDCDYKPCGITAPLARVVDSQKYLHQAGRPKRLNARLWQRCLAAIGCDDAHHAGVRRSGQRDKVLVPRARGRRRGFERLE